MDTSQRALRQIQVRRPGVSRAPERAALDGRSLSETAWHALHERHKDRVYEVCLRLTANHSDALDATQETLLRVFQNLCRCRESAALEGWIRSIAVNASHDVHRRARKREQLSIEAVLDRRGQLEARARDTDTSQPGPERDCVCREEAEVVQRAIARLPALLREAVRLRYLEGLDYEDVAAALGVPLGTVKSRLSRAHEILRRALEPRVAEIEIA